MDITEAMKISPSVKLTNYTYKNNGDLTFKNVSADWGLDEKTFSNGSAYADLDNDGDLDLVVNNINDPASIYENTLDKGVNFIRILPIADDPEITNLNTKVWIELDGAQQYSEITSVRGMYSTSEYVAHFGLGKKKPRLIK